jgi:BirA family biotin operon repressor/biotin-[acetyl-CoA-carboxylase] ligase
MDHDRNGIFRNIIICLDHRYDQLRKGDFVKLKRDYLSVLYRYNETGYFKSTEKFRGRITGIDVYGRLMIETGGSTRVFSLKEIEFLEE